MASSSEYVDDDILALEGEQKIDQMTTYKLHEEVGDPPKRKRGFKFALPSEGSSSKRPKLEKHSEQASYADPSPESIQLVKDYIESRQLMKARRHIKAIESKFPFSLITQALKAHVHATIDGVDGAPVLSEDFDPRIFSDESFVLNVMPILEAVWVNVGDLVTPAFIYWNKASANDLALMRRKLNCYSRLQLFKQQLKVTYAMYLMAQEDKFLFWAVFCIQLQVLYHFITKKMITTSLDEPEPFLVYMSATEQQEFHCPGQQNSPCLVCEVLSKLGPTLLVVKADKTHIEAGGRLLSHICDYSAAVEFLKKIIDQRGLHGVFNELEWDVKFFGKMDDSDSHSVRHLACQISQLANETQCGSKILEQLKLLNLEKVKSRCLLDGKDNDVFEEAVYEYFTRVDPTTQKFFQIFSKDEEYLLIDNLLKQDVITTDLLKENLSKICTDSKIPRYFNDFCVGLTSAVHGLMLVVKTSKFIILAGDGVLTSRYSDNALFSTTDKIRQFDDLCIGVNGVFKILSKTVSNMRKYVRQVKKDTRFRPTVKASANHIAKKACMLKEAFEVIVCGFDELEVGQPPVASVSCARNGTSWDPNKDFHCSGRFGNYAASILSEGKIGAHTGLLEAICWVERALVFPAIFDTCMGGLGNITVIDNCKNVTVMARELIHTTLWERHHHFFQNMMSRGA